jgi:sterol desaturase/sphingolipid hydroxylase (fatty acid hydroxylase superfamily)/uncharacterized protein (DUF2147 family)
MTLCLETFGSIPLETIWSYTNTWFDIFLGDAGRYVVTAVAVWVVLWVVLAGPLQRRKIRPDRPASRQLVTEFAFSMRTATVFSLGGLTIYAMAMAGWLRADEAAALGWTWGVPCLLLMIVAHDAYFYWGHRLLHHTRFFRWAHRQHHRSHNPSPFTAYSFDLAEATLLMPFVPLWVLIVPTAWDVVAIFMLHQIVRNVIGHSGYEIFPARANGRPLFDWMTTVTHHDLHHAQAGWNYGLYFTWWDRWMGTEHPEYYARFAAATGRQKPESASGSIAAILILGIGLTVLSIPGQSRAETAGIHGSWATQGFGSIVVMNPCEDASSTICGRILWLWAALDQNGQMRTDAANPDEAARARPLVGTIILRGFSETAPGIWTGGSVYNPDDGRSYSGTIRLLASGALELKGCALAIFCQSQYWRRPHDILQEVARLRL